jgi:hypothetical protein
MLVKGSNGFRSVEGFRFVEEEVPEVKVRKPKKALSTEEATPALADVQGEGVTQEVEEQV